MNARRILSDRRVARARPTCAAARAWPVKNTTRTVSCGPGIVAFASVLRAIPMLLMVYFCPVTVMADQRPTYTVAANGWPPEKQVDSRRHEPIGVAV